TPRGSEATIRIRDRSRRLFDAREPPQPRLAVADAELVAGELERPLLIGAEILAARVGLDVVNDDSLRGVDGISAEVRDECIHPRDELLAACLAIARARQPRQFRFSCDLDQHVPGLVVDEVSDRLFAEGILPRLTARL